MSLHLNLLDIDHPLTFEVSKLRQIEAHVLIYLSDKQELNNGFIIRLRNREILHTGLISAPPVNAYTRA